MRSSTNALAATPSGRLAMVILAVGLAGGLGCKKDPQLRVTGIEPNSGDALGGTFVRILGNRFTSDGARSAKIYFGGRLAAPPRFASDAEMVVEAPGGEAGKTVDVLIIFEPGGELKIANGFSYYERKTRTIEDVGTKPTPK